MKWQAIVSFPIHTLLLEGRLGGPAAEDEEPEELIVATSRDGRWYSTI
jgi:hypothetical protein